MYFFFFTNQQPNITGYVFLAPIPIIILLILAIGIGMILATLSVFFKDIEYVYEVFCMILFYMTPIFYHADQLKLSSGFIGMCLKANPLYSITEMFRCAVLYGRMFTMSHLIYSLAFSLGVFVIGFFVFYKKQDKFILHI